MRSKIFARSLIYMLPPLATTRRMSRADTGLAITPMGAACARRCGRRIRGHCREGCHQRANSCE
jgi:hypothetical protein